MKKNRKKHAAPPATESHESVATLAGGMADDFNNILTTVMGACSLIDRDDPANGELLRCVALIRASAEHAADLSGRLMQAGTPVRGNVDTERRMLISCFADTSVRDKKSADAVVSTKNHPGGATS